MRETVFTWAISHAPPVSLGRFDNEGWNALPRELFDRRIELVAKYVEELGLDPLSQVLVQGKQGHAAELNLETDQVK